MRLLRSCVTGGNPESSSHAHRLVVQAVIFDIDGTLLDSSGIDAQLYDFALTSVLGPVRLRDGWDAYTHVTDESILHEVLLDNGVAASDAVVGQIKTAFFDALSAHIARHGAIPEVRGARRFVETLQRAGVGVAYATGGWATSAKMKLRSAGFPVAGVALATSDDSGVRVEIMRTALQRLGGGFEHITYYGDGEWDRAAARELGWNFEAVGKALGGITEYVNSATEPDVEADN